MKRIAIVGSGFFGLSLAIKLSKKFSVDVFEKKGVILGGASKANQLRYHLGYHYPRSYKTLKEVQIMHRSFERFFGKSVFGRTDNYYGIAKKKTKTSFKDYINFLKRNKLFFNIVKSHDYSEKVEGAIISNEKNLNYFKAKSILSKKIKKKNIKVYLNKSFVKENLSRYYKVIIACYDQNNIVLKNLNIKPKKKYKFELVEKILIKLPKYFKNKSYMVLDGKFVSLDPYLGTAQHLLSDVKYSKIEISKGYFPKFKDYRKKFVNKGIITTKKISNFKKFIKRSSKFLPFLINAKYKGSFFVIRAIELNKETTDERVNSINFFGKKVITIFSGKWNTSIGLSEILYKNIK